MTKVFISYSWDDEDHKIWAEKFAAHLSEDGIEIILDQWHTGLGDRIIMFMQNAVRESDFVLCICTPRYKEKSDLGSGGVGYEGYIMTAEFFQNPDQGKFIPILQRGEWIESAPSWLLGVGYADLRGGPSLEKNYQELLTKLKSKIKVVSIPVAVYAMTSNEAERFSKSSKPEHQKILKMFSEHGVKNIVEYYSESRDLWRPLVGEDKTMRVLVEEMAAAINEKSNIQPIGFDFCSDDLFSGDSERFWAAYKKFRTNNGILIVDAVSLFFDELKSCLVTCNLLGNAAIMTLHPLGMDRFEISSLILQKNGVLQRGEFNVLFSRFGENDKNCDLAVSDIWHVKRWLAHILPASRDRMLNRNKVVDERRNGVHHQITPSGSVRDFVMGER